jgi:hypothetical protein
VCRRTSAIDDVTIEQMVGIVRDDTRPASGQKHLITERTAERTRADHIADIASSLLAASTERELQDAVLEGVTPAFGGFGILLASSTTDDFAC